jgi:hypothetical protein
VTQQRLRQSPYYPTWTMIHPFDVVRQVGLGQESEFAHISL